MAAIPTKIRLVDGATEIQIAGSGLNYTSSVFTRQFDLGFPQHRSFTQAQSGADGEYDLTRYMGSRTIQMSILITNDHINNLSRHQIADMFKSMCLAYKRIYMYVTFEGMSEYRMTVRGVSAGYSVEKASHASLQLSMTFYCAAGLMESADMYVETMYPQNLSGGSVYYYDSDADRRGTDMSVTNASTTVTSATAAFVAGDVGRQIQIVKVPYQIASVTNGTTALLTMAYAGTTGSSKDWQFTPGLPFTNTGINFTSGGFNNLQISNPEEVPTPPVIRIYGPITDPLITRLADSLDGTASETLQLYFPGLTVATGEYLEIDSASRSVTNTDGTLPLTKMDISSSWWYLNPGTNVITLTGTGTTSDTIANIYFRTRKV